MKCENRECCQTCEVVDCKYAGTWIAFWTECPKLKEQPVNHQSAFEQLPPHLKAICVKQHNYKPVWGEYNSTAEASEAYIDGLSRHKIGSKEMTEIRNKMHNTMVVFAALELCK